MDELEKKVISFFLGADTMEKLDAIRVGQRRNRSSQIAFLIDQAFTAMFPAGMPVKEPRAIPGEDFGDRP